MGTKPFPLHQHRCRHCCSAPPSFSSRPQRLADLCCYRYPQMHPLQWPDLMWQKSSTHPLTPPPRTPTYLPLMVSSRLQYKVYTPTQKTRQDFTTPPHLPFHPISHSSPPSTYPANAPAMLNYCEPSQTPPPHASGLCRGHSTHSPVPSFLVYPVTYCLTVLFKVACLREMHLHIFSINDFSPVCLYTLASVPITL